MPKIASVNPSVVNLPTVLPFDSRTARTWADIHLDRLAQNARWLQQFVAPQGEIMAVVKADAYGHGAVPVARVCAAMGVKHTAIASVAEAAELRRAGIAADLYLLSPFFPEEAESIVRLDIVPFISSEFHLQALAEAARPAPFPQRCFLTVDTGMGREGCLFDAALDLWQQTQHSQAHLRITGIATHFASADEDNGTEATHEQIAAFYRFLERLPAGTLAGATDDRGGEGIYLTLSNSPATLRYTLPMLPDGIRKVLYRAGLLLYGIEPYRGAFSAFPNLASVLSWHARVTLLKELPAGATVGYGRTHTLTRCSKIATLAVGYADGLSRRLSNTGQVIIGGQRFPIVGRVSMDQCQIDVTDATFPIVMGMVATIIGGEGDTRQTVLDIAEQIDTTPHEPTCDLSRRVTRQYANATPPTDLLSPPSRDRRP